MEPSSAIESSRSASAPAKELKTVSSARLLEAMRGYTKSDRAEIVLAHWENMTATPEGQREMSEALASEGCSEGFAKKLMNDPDLRKRVLKICEKFDAQNERMARLEEAEIYCALMEKGAEDISAMREGVQFEGKFPGMRDLKPAELRETRLKKLATMGHAAMQADKKNVMYVEALSDSFAKALGKKAPEGKRVDMEWQQSALNEIAQDPQALQRLLEDPNVKEMYALTHPGRSIESSHRKIELAWKTQPDGTRIPVMYAEGMAVPAKTKSGESAKCSVLSFSLEGRMPQGTEAPQQRILKDIVIKIDHAQRGKNEGIKFLLDKMPLTKKYKIQEVQFNANIKIGSYAWRFADMDVHEMAQMNFEDGDWEAIGGKGNWNETKESKAEQRVMMKFVLPVYEQQFYAAMGQLPPEWRAKNAATMKRWQAELESLKERAAVGAVTMEDLANLGEQEEKAFWFDEEGTQTDNPAKAKNRGHMGKAAIMGLPWYAKVGTDRTSLSRVIDKLYKGSTMKSLLMKAGLVLFH